MTDWIGFRLDGGVIPGTGNIRSTPTPGAGGSFPTMRKSLVLRIVANVIKEPKNLVNMGFSGLLA